MHWSSKEVSLSISWAKICYTIQETICKSLSTINKYKTLEVQLMFIFFNTFLWDFLNEEFISFNVHFYYCVWKLFHVFVLYEGALLQRKSYYYFSIYWLSLFNTINTLNLIINITNFTYYYIFSCHFKRIINKH